ncbi:MAG: hypothetical protein IJ646_14745 [Clostridia bacterium]|nr:hypothetical protein [Clostridia bacterium]
MKFKNGLAMLVAVVLFCMGLSAFAEGDKFDLDNFDYRTVVTKGRGKLVFQSSPGGSFMYDFKFYNGDEIFVNLNYRKNGYALAFKGGTYGYVDASYIDWRMQPDPEPDPEPDRSYVSKKDLSNFDWRRVDSNGRGSLVFQQAPYGKSIKGHKFYDGDWIFVNVNYREKGYGYAYEDGEYGYVDASFIDW